MPEAEPYVCDECGFSLWAPIGRLGVSSLGLYDDARYPGRCLLVLGEHHEDFAELPLDLTQAFVADAQHAGRAIRRAVSAERINYAILGNASPHLHFHLIPRGDPDPAPSRSPWNTTVPQTSLPPGRRDRLVRSIALQLSQAGDEGSFTGVTAGDAGLTEGLFDDDSDLRIER